MIVGKFMYYAVTFTTLFVSLFGYLELQLSKAPYDYICSTTISKLSWRPAIQVELSCWNQWAIFQL